MGNDMRLYAMLMVFAALSLAVGIAGADTTVTLTGTCSGIVSNGTVPYVNFTLSNSGNGPASSVSLLATAASPYGLSSSTSNGANTLLPGRAETFTFYLANGTYHGRYGFGVYVSYAQDQQTFVVTFPCIAAANGTSNPVLIIQNLSSGNGLVTAKVFNMGAASVTGRLYFIAPPALALSPRAMNFTIGPQGSYSLSSNMSMTSSYNGTVTLSAVVSYVSGNAVSSYMVTSQVSLQRQGHPVDLTWAVVAAVVMAVVALIIASLVLKRKR